MRPYAGGARLAGALALALALGVAWAPGAARAQPMGLPSLGQTASAELSPEVERILGQAIMEQGRLDPDYVADLDINQYLTGLGHALAAHAPQPLRQEITVFAVRDPAINAFALPGGYIGINSGLVQAAGSEAELAGVLAHEISHVMQRHIARSISAQSQNTGIMVASLIGALLAGLAGQGQLAMGVASFGQAAAIDRQLGFSRAVEQEADRAGLQMLRAAGFDGAGMVDMFRRLMDASRLNQGNASGYAATHPLSLQRISDLQGRLPPAAAGRLDINPEFWFVRARLGLVQARSGAPRQHLLQVLQADSRSASGAPQAAALYALAQEAHEAGAAARARELLAQSQALVPSPQAAVLAVALANDAGAALQLAQSAWQQWPQSQEVALVRANSLQAAGKNTQAVEFLRELTGRWPEVAQFYRLLATALERVGQSVEAHEAMASFYEASGAIPTAVEHLQQARAQSHDFYQQSRLDVRIRGLQDRLQAQRELLAPFKRN